MDDLVDYGVVYDVLNKTYLEAHERNRVNLEVEKVVYGGPLHIDLTNEVGSLGEYVLRSLREVDPRKIAFVSDILVPGVA